MYFNVIKISKNFFEILFYLFDYIFSYSDKFRFYLLFKLKEGIFILCIYNSIKIMVFVCTCDGG